MHNTNSDADALDALPPHSEEAEQGVLGCILLEPDKCLPICIERLKERTDFFYALNHQTIFQAILALGKARESIDVVTVQQWLRDESLLSDAGGISYLAALPDLVSSTANLSSYLDIVIEKHQARSIIFACRNVINGVVEHEKDFQYYVDKAQRDLELVWEQNKRKSGANSFTVADLDGFDPANDPENRIGDRYLCTFGKLIITATSGAGKSSWLVQMLISFALGKPFCGIVPHGPRANGELTSCIIGDENDRGDMAEMWHGSRGFLKTTSADYPKDFKTLVSNLKFWDCPSLAGPAFLSWLESELRKDPRDICAIDPVVSFAGVDLSKQESASIFLRQGLSRICASTGVIFILINHTPKPSKENGSNKGTRRILDAQHAGAGSFDMAGWARAMITIEEATDGVFRVILSKRGAKSGACHPDGTPTRILWMRHATRGIFWEHIDPPSETSADDASGPRQTSAGKPNKILAVVGSNLFEFLSGCKTEGESGRAIAKRLGIWWGQHGTEHRALSINTCRRIIEALCEPKCRKLDLNKEGLFIKGANA